MVGPLKSASVNFDQHGKSKGTAEVSFVAKADALAALSRYNGATLDGQPMSIEVVAAAAAALGGAGRGGIASRVGGAATPQRTVTFAGGAPRSFGAAPQRMIGSGGGRPRGGGRGAGGARPGGGGGGSRGGGRSGRGKAVEKSAAELDAEMESYHAAAGAGGMQE